MPFKVTIGEKSWLTEDLTLDELVQIEKEAEESWTFVISAPLKSAAHGKAILVAFLAREYGPEEGAKRAGVLTFKQILDAFDYVEDDKPKQYRDGMPVVDPKAPAESKTDTSSPPPTTGDGPPT